MNAPTRSAPAGTLAEMVAQMYAHDWKDRAVCRGLDPALFFLERGNGADQAKAACARCPVRRECLDYAIANDSPGHEYGIYGGMTAAERRTMRQGTFNMVENAS